MADARKIHKAPKRQTMDGSSGGTQDSKGNQDDAPKPVVVEPLSKDVLKVQHTGASQDDFSMDTGEVITKIQYFYCDSHYCENLDYPHIGTPQTIIAAHTIGEAQIMLERELIKIYGKEKVQQHPFKVVPFPLDNRPGVAILSMGTMDLPQPWNGRPILHPCKSDASELNVYVCTSHYTSETTPAATVILAGSSMEATTFLLDKLQQMGAPDTRALEVKPIGEQPGVHFLLRYPVHKMTM